jgi:hypothetical protein
MYLTRTIFEKVAYNHFIPVTITRFKSTQTHLYLVQEYQVEMATQRALLVQEIGKPLVLVHDHPILEPGNGQVQIKVTIAGKSD